MEFRKDGNLILLCLARGEEVIATINEWAKKEGIRGASISGIGAISDVELGIYDPATGAYQRRLFSGEYELVSLTGNITEIGLHAHVCISGRDYVCHGGHLSGGKIAIVGEFAVISANPIAKVPLEGTKFMRWDLGKK